MGWSSQFCQDYQVMQIVAAYPYPLSPSAPLRSLIRNGFPSNDREMGNLASFLSLPLPSSFVSLTSFCDSEWVSHHVGFPTFLSDSASLRSLIDSEGADSGEAARVDAVRETVLTIMTQLDSMHKASNAVLLQVVQRVCESAQQHGIDFNQASVQALAASAVGISDSKSAETIQETVSQVLSEMDDRLNALVMESHEQQTEVLSIAAECQQVLEGKQASVSAHMCVTQIDEFA